MKNLISEEKLRKLFNKSYGQKAPTKAEWAAFYEKDVIFIDPTQEKKGLDLYIQAQDKLIKRTDDVFLTTHKIASSGDVCFIEWTMGLKILNKEFIYPGTTRLIFSDNGLIKTIQDGSVTKYDGNMKAHHHLKCSQCGSITDIDLHNLNLNEKIKAKFDFEPIDFEVTKSE